jgi:uncharacterized protein
MAAESYPKPIPDVDDPLMAPFWAAARDGKLIAQRCPNCHALRFPPLPICDTCLAEGGDWVDVSTQGVIWSYVVYHRAFHPGFHADLPYVVAIVENEDGLSFVGNVLGDRDRIQVGASVRAVFDAVTAMFTMVKWEIADT